MALNCTIFLKLLILKLFQSHELWGNFIFWYYPPGLVFLFHWFAPVRQSRYAIFYIQAVFTNTGYAHRKTSCIIFLGEDHQENLRLLLFELFWQFREGFEFYFPGFLNGIELYNILKTLDFKIIPKSWGNFVFWYNPPGSVFLNPSFAPIRQSRYAIFYMQAVSTNTGYAHGKDYTYLAPQRPLGKCLTFNFSDRFREVFEFYFTGL